jgi:hypothetical protein
LSIVFALDGTNQLNLLPDKDLVDLCLPIEPYQVTKNLESQVKQIGFRVKIAGASWNSGNVPQVLRHRCAYLNGSLF